MPKFVIGSVYLLKNKTKMHYLGDQAGVLHFKDLKSGETYTGLPIDVELETTSVSVTSTATTTTSTATTRTTSK